MSNPAGRELAWQVMNRVETEGAYANLALQEVLSKYGETNQREKAFCTELVYGTLRQLLKIDYILGRLLSRPLKSLHPAIKNALRLALYQLLFLTEIPGRAVCHSTVEMVKTSKYRGLAPLVNGVLRNHLRQPDGVVMPDYNQERLRYLEVEYSHPRWLVQRWLERFGPERTEALLKTNNERPPLTVRVNRAATTTSAVLDSLKADGIEVQPGEWLPEALHLAGLPLALEETAAFQKGWLAVQDESSMLVAHLVAPAPGETIVDLCAAPGGKSTHLAELMGNQGRIISLDDHPHKAQLIQENAQRLNLNIIEPRVADARQFVLPDCQKADAVLVDAPCSGTGVLRRRVDARYRREVGELAQLATLQREILNHAATLVRPGGRLVYSTCTLEPEENQQQSEWFLANHPDYEIVDYQPFLPVNLPNFQETPDQRWVTLLPTAGGGDGFFICRFQRRG